MSRSIEARRDRRRENEGLCRIARERNNNTIERIELGRVLFTKEGEIAGGRVFFLDPNGDNNGTVTVRRMPREERDLYSS